MNTLPAQEIKRRGIAAVDEVIAKGDLHLIEIVVTFQVPEYAFVQKRRNVEYALFTIRKFQVQFISGKRFN